MATVNGRPIYMGRLHKPLVRAHGLRLAEMLIADVVVRQEADRRGISVSDAEVAAEERAALAGILGDDYTPQQKQRLLGQLLHERGLTRSVWDAVMRRNALLRKMVEPDIEVTEADLRAEFERVHGEKISASHIQLPTLDEAQKVLKLLREKADFATLARRHSTNTETARDGGRLPDFSRTDPTIPPAIREAAFAVAEPPALAGPVQVGTEFHVLKVHGRVVSPNVPFESVKVELARQVQQRAVEQAQMELLEALKRRAEVEYVNPILREQAARYAPTP
jgi:foldase protein PrsA